MVAPLFPVRFLYTGTTVGYSRLWKKGAVHAVGMLAFDYPGQKAAEILTMYEYPEELQLHVIYRYDQVQAICTYFQD